MRRLAAAAGRVVAYLRSTHPAVPTWTSITAAFLVMVAWRDTVLALCLLVIAMQLEHRAAIFRLRRRIRALERASFMAKLTSPVRADRANGAAR